MSDEISPRKPKSVNSDGAEETNGNHAVSERKRSKKKDKAAKKIATQEDNVNEGEEELMVPEPTRIKRKKKKAVPVEESEPTVASEHVVSDSSDESKHSDNVSTSGDPDQKSVTGSEASTESKKKKGHLRAKLRNLWHHKPAEDTVTTRPSDLGNLTPRSMQEEEEALAELLKQTSSPSAARDTPSSETLNAAEYLASVVSPSPMAPMLGLANMGGTTASGINVAANRSPPQISISAVRSPSHEDDIPFSDSQAHRMDNGSTQMGASTSQLPDTHASTSRIPPFLNTKAGSIEDATLRAGATDRKPTLAGTSVPAAGVGHMDHNPSSDAPAPPLNLKSDQNHRTVSPMPPAADFKGSFLAAPAPQGSSSNAASANGSRSNLDDIQQRGVVANGAPGKMGASNNSNAAPPGSPDNNRATSGTSSPQNDPNTSPNNPSEAADSIASSPNAVRSSAPHIKSSGVHSSELGEYFFRRMQGGQVDKDKLAEEKKKELDKQQKKREKHLRKRGKPVPGHEFDHILGTTEEAAEAAIESKSPDKPADHSIVAALDQAIPDALNPHLFPTDENRAKVKEKMKFNREDGRFKYKGSAVRIPIEIDKKDDYEILKFSHNSWSGVRYYWAPDGYGRLSYITGEAQYIGHWKKGVRHGLGEGSAECKKMEGIYHGEWKNGKPGGQGKFLTKKFTYDGGWEGGLRHGFGDYHTEKLRYVGDWSEDKKHGYGIITYGDGTRYEGEWKGDERGGFGVCRYPDGSIYTGMWADNERHGKGTSIYANGNRYVGEWYKDMRQGNGALYGALHQKLYEGNWWRNKRHGQGTAWFVDTGDRYEGEWFLGKQHGEGDWTGADGSSYKGSYVDGFRHGTGLVIYASGDRYVGEWVRGTREGNLCAYVYKDYGKYVGPFVEDRACGNGEYHTFASRKIAGFFESRIIEDELGRYQGLTLNGKKYGRGIQVYENGDRYDGEWRDGMRYGYGIMQYEDGGRYVGFWLKDERSKLGTYSLPSGEKYVGRWLKDKRHGIGTMMFENNDRLVDAQWVNDAPVDGIGTFVYANKSVYRGTLKSGVPNGRGSLTMLISVLLAERAEYRKKIGLHYFLRGEKKSHKEDPEVKTEYEEPEPSNMEEDITAYVESAKQGKKKQVAVFQPNTITFWREFKQGKMIDGPGLSIWDGNAYEGDFIGYERSGIGKMARTTGETYYGQWKHDREWGLGEVKTRSLDTYIGHWYNGFRNGVGSQSYDEGGVFCGKWMNDRRHGIGIFVWPDKSMTTREYYKGELVSKRVADIDWAKKQLAAWGVEKLSSTLRSFPYAYAQWATGGLPDYYDEAMLATKPGDDSDSQLDALRFSRSDLPRAGQISSSSSSSPSPSLSRASKS